MTNSKVKIPFISFFLFVTTNYVQITAESNDIFHQTNKKIFEIIDDIFISLEINKNFNGSKNIADYLLMKNFIQDAAEKNEQVYEHIQHTSKSKELNKSVNSNIYNAVAEVIGEKKAKITQDLFNSGIHIRTKSDDRVLSDFVNLANAFNLKLNSLFSDDLWGSDINSQNLTRRIFDGFDTTIRRYPFIVSIHLRGRFCCAGSLIREDLVITAASCLIQLVYQNFDPTALFVRVGSDYVNKAGKLIPTAALHFHPSFNPSNLNHNLVIIQLKTNVKFEKKKVISIKFAREANDEAGDAKEVIILGWGEKKSSESRLNSVIEDQVLAQASLDMYDLEKCKASYSRFYVNNLNFCAGFVYKGSGACKNDVGGPAIVHSTLTGVVSFGSPHCGRPDVPTVFTKISAYATWIDSVFKEIQLCNQPDCKLRGFSNENHVPDTSDEFNDKYKLAATNQDHFKLRKKKPDVSDPEKADEIYASVEAVDTFTTTPAQDVHTHPLVSKSIFLDPDLIDLPVFSEEKTEETPPLVFVTPEPLNADQLEKNIDWDYVKGLVDQVLQLANETTTTTKDTTPQYTQTETKTSKTTRTIFTESEKEDAYGEFTFKTSAASLALFTRMGDSIDESDTNIDDEESLKIDYENQNKMFKKDSDPAIRDQKSSLKDILSNKENSLENEHEDFNSNIEKDPANKNRDNEPTQKISDIESDVHGHKSVEINNAEVIIIDSGTTIRYVLDKRNPKTIDELDKLKENFADHIID